MAWCLIAQLVRVSEQNSVVVGVRIPLRPTFYSYFKESFSGEYQQYQFIPLHSCDYLTQEKNKYKINILKIISTIIPFITSFHEDTEDNKIMMKNQSLPKGIFKFSALWKPTLEKLLLLLPLNCRLHWLSTCKFSIPCLWFMSLIAFKKIIQNYTLYKNQ